MGEGKALLALQEVDLELMRAKRSVEELPEKGRITKVRSASRKVTSELNRIVGVRKDLEMAIADNETDRAKVSELVDEAQGKV